MSSQRAIVMLRDSAGGEAQAHLLGGEQVDDEGRVCAVLDDAGSLVLPLGGEAELELQGSRVICSASRRSSKRCGPIPRSPITP